ncbi:MAG: ABC transporter ATP-binding protein [Gemmatimonadaceae bacterium]
MANVTLAGVRKVYENGHVAVHEVNLEVEDGEFIVLVGPSGCGKSTTLRIIAGLEPQSTGTVSIGGRVVSDMAPKDRDIAMVFQSYALYPHMSVYQNLAFALKLRKLPRKEIDERVQRAANILGIQPILNRKPKQLSGGQRQRVAVGRAIVREPQVFLFDEPLSNLDAKLRVQMRREIAKLHRDLSATIIYVTHDQVEAMTMGDRIVVMNEGRVQQIDTPLNLYNHPVNTFVAGFIGSPAMNFIEGAIVRNGTATFQAGDGSISLPVAGVQSDKLAEHAGRKVIAGIRPEDIYVAGSVRVTGPTSTARLRLDNVEPMGNEVFLYASSESNHLTARVAPSPPHGSRLEPGGTVDLAFDLGKLHFFDVETGLLIGEGSSIPTAIP